MCACSLGRSVACNFAVHYHSRGLRMARKIMFLAAVALVALAGVAYAAGSITGKSIKDNSITGKDIKNKSLTRKDFKGSVRGPQGGVGRPKGQRAPRGSRRACRSRRRAGPTRSVDAQHSEPRVRLNDDRT